MTWLSGRYGYRPNCFRAGTDLSLQLWGFWDWRMGTGLLRCHSSELGRVHRLLAEQTWNFLQNRDAEVGS